MGRMTLRQWNDRNPQRISKATAKRRAMSAITKAVRDKMLKDGVIVKKPPKEKATWRFVYGDHVGTVLAYTRSEARSEVKKTFGLNKLTKPLTLKVVDGLELSVDAA